MQADEIIRAPSVGRLHPRRKAACIGGAQLRIGARSGKPRLEGRVTVQQRRRFNTDAEYDILLTKSVALGTRVLRSEYAVAALLAKLS